MTTRAEPGAAGKPSARTTFVWGLKRSGIHLVVNWLYANHGGVAKDDLVTDGLHPQLDDGFADRSAGVAFFNNCGGLHSRRFELGDLMPEDFALAAARHRSTVFGIEDCALQLAVRTADVPGAVNLLLLRDPLNNVASRLRAATSRPQLFPVGKGFVDVLEAYCAEALGYTHHLPAKVLVSFNRFVDDRRYRDALAETLGLENLDATSEVSSYGGGSSFSDDRTPSPASLLMTRYHQHPVPRPLLDLLLERDAVREACSRLFGYELADQAGDA